MSQFNIIALAGVADIIAAGSSYSVAGIVLARKYRSFF